MEQGLSLLETKLFRIEMNQVMEFPSMYYELSGSTQTCVVHGDFHYDNVLWDEEAGRLGVIDFSEGGIEDPALDLCICPRNSVERYLRSTVQSREIYTKEAKYITGFMDYMIWLKLSRIILASRISKKGIVDFLIENNIHAKSRITAAFLMNVCNVLMRVDEMTRIHCD